MRPILLLSLALAVAACTAAPATESPWAPLPTLPPTTPLADALLIDYAISGGVAGVHTAITVNRDGAASLTGGQTSAPVTWTVPGDRLGALKTLLLNSSFASLVYDPDPASNCADCFVYSVNALTPQGVKTLRFNESTINSKPNVSPRYKELVAIMGDIINSAPTVTPPPPIALPPITPSPQPIGASPPPASATPGPAATQPISHGAGALPPDVLLIYNRQGGFAYSNLTLTIKLNGAAALSSDTAQPRQFTIEASDLAALNSLLSDPALAGLSKGHPSVCADCYTYTVTARTPGGVILLKADDAALSAGQWGPYQKLLDWLSVYLK